MPCFLDSQARPVFERALGIWERIPGAEAEARFTRDFIPTHSLIPPALLPFLPHAPSPHCCQAFLPADIPSHPQVAKVLNNLGLLHRTLGRLEEALPFYERSLALREQALVCAQDGSGTTPRVTSPHHTLLMIDSLTLGYYLSVRLCPQGVHHPDVATAANNLAGVFYRTGDYERARELFLRSLAIWETGARGPERASLWVSGVPAWGKARD